MQEIAPNVFIDHNSLNLINGIVRTESGSVLIDSPSRQDDARSWRSGTARLVMGDPKFLICLDTNYDRVLSSKGADCVVVSHFNSANITKGKVATTRLLDDGAGEFETHEQIVVNPLRWNPPEIVFDDRLTLHLGGEQIDLEYHCGSNSAGVWVVLPQQKVVFVGDTVLVDQPPFLASADLTVWIADLFLLGSKLFRGFQIVSSRNGIVSTEQVIQMRQLIEWITERMDPLVNNNADLDAFNQLIPELMDRIQYTPENEEQFFHRLHWGFSAWYEQHKKG